MCELKANVKEGKTTFPGKAHKEEVIFLLLKEYSVTQRNITVGINQTCLHYALYFKYL